MTVLIFVLIMKGVIPMKGDNFFGFMTLMLIGILIDLFVVMRLLGVY